MWLDEFRTSSSNKHTHLLLNGGKLHVKDSQHTVFLNKYARAVFNQDALYVVEAKTPVFRLFVDFDFQPVPDPRIITAGIQTMAAVVEFYFDIESDPSDAVVLRKDIESSEKVGIHMTWDKVYVTPQLARAFRDFAVKKLQQEDENVAWDTVVDGSVYGGSGLRMPWSKKVNAKGVYVPIMTVDRRGTVTTIPTPVTIRDILQWVYRTSIRSPGAQPSSTCIVTETPRDDTKSIGTGQKEHLDAFAEPLRLVQEVMPDAFRDQTFTSMHRYDTCIVLRSSSKRCGNKGYQPHASSNVYFVLLKHKGIGYQRCFSRKDIVRDQGVACVDYVGPTFTIPERAMSMLWPVADQRTASHSKLELLLSKTRPKIRVKKKKKAH